MLALSLLLSAAAGVNAILGGEVEAVQISEGEFICADDCVYKGAYFAQQGYWCPEDQIIGRVDENGKGHKWFPFDCQGAKQPKGWGERPLKDGDKPRECEIFKSTATEPDLCISFKTTGGGKKIVQWSEVEKELKSATASTTEKNKPAPPKSKQECLKMGQQKMSECRQKISDFKVCEKQGGEAIKNCMDGK